MPEARGSSAERQRHWEGTQEPSKVQEQELSWPPLDRDCSLCCKRVQQRGLSQICRAPDCF